MKHNDTRQVAPSPPDGGDVTVGGAEQQVDDGVSVRLLGSTPRVDVAHRVLQTVVVVKVEDGHQLLKK